MRASIAVVADDLTGAADAGIGFARAGLTTDVRWLNDATDGPASTDLPLDAIQVLAIDTGSRALPLVEAVRRTATVVSRLEAAGLVTLYKKIDSTLRGHVGEELAAALGAWHPGSVAVVAPAFPAMGRTTRHGELRLDGAPTRDSSIVRRIEQAGLRSDQVDLGRVRGGNLALLLCDCRDRGVRAVVCDAEADADLDAIAAAGVALAPRILWVGSGGLAHALGRQLAPSPAGLIAGAPSHADRPGVASPSRPGRSPDAPPRPVLLVAGSRTAVAREQVGHLVATGTVPVVARSRHLLEGSGGDLCARVVALLGRGLDVVVSIESSSDSPGHEDVRLTSALGRLLRPAADAVGGLVLTGGDTALGILRAWDVTALRLVGEVEPGVPFSTTQGARILPVVTKAGGFGGPSVLAAARDRLREAT